MPYTVARGPVQGNERGLAPDLARGAMLMFIALANATGVVFAGPGVEPHPEGLDRALNLIMNTFVHARAYPVFAVMFGYGLVQLAHRQTVAGATPHAVRSLLLRRNLWLIVFGFVHATLLYYGDFLGAYGLIGIAATLALLGRSDRVHRIVLWIWAVTIVEVCGIFVMVAVRLTHTSNAIAPVPVTQVASLLAPDYASSVTARLAEWPMHTASVLPAILIVWLGMWAARRRLLDDPSSHLLLLRRVAIASLGIAFLGGLPLGLVSAGMLDADAGAMSATVFLHQASGMFGGPGYVAVAALASDWLSRRPASRGLARIAGSVSALGQRSLSAYLFQSVVWKVLLMPITSALGSRFNDPLLTAMAVAVLTWIGSLAAADAMQRYRYRGPAETLLRRLTYGTTSLDRRG